VKHSIQTEAISTSPPVASGARAAGIPWLVSRCTGCMVAFCVVVSLTFVMPVIARAADEIHFTVTGLTSVTFDWRGSTSENVIKFGTASGSYTRSVTAVHPTPLPYSSSGPFWEAKLTGLSSRTLYYYKIASRMQQTFKTPPVAGSSGFTLVTEGDIGDTSSYANVAVVQQLINTLSPDLVLAVGDLTYGNAHGQTHVDRSFNDMMVWSERIPYMPAWGNHEWDSSGDNLRNYKGRFNFVNPQTSPGSPSVSCCGEDWYWFDYGNTRFIAYPEPWSGALFDWNTKANTIMNQAQSDLNIKFIVTFGHRPAYSSGHHPGESTLKRYLDALGDSHSKYVLNINGHSHNYERSYPQHRVTHITAGTGGSSLEEDGSCLFLTCSKPSWSAKRYMRQGITVLTFAPTGIQGKFICGPAGGGKNDINCTVGQVIDTFTISSASSHSGD
jgi:hypothetical protein